MDEMEFDKEKVNNYYNSNYSDTDEDYVNDLFINKEKEGKLKALLYRQFYELMSDKVSENKNLENILYKIHYNINSSTSKANSLTKINRIFTRSAGIAAILILPIAIYLAFQTFSAAENEKLAWIEIKAPAWTRAQFILPDGTTGWLNSNSSIKYNGKFYSDRQVSLKGEAFFDVYKDNNRPFFVNTEEVTIKVLGTRFNIASYENEEHVEVVLEEGALIFNSKRMGNSITMKPNDLIVYDKSHKDLSTEVVQPQKYLSWTEGKLVFRNDPLDVIARRLERWYNIDVEVNGAFAEDLRLRATFIDESVEEVLGLLQRSLSVKCKIVKRTLSADGSFTKTRVIITPKNK